MLDKRLLTNLLMLGSTIMRRFLRTFQRCYPSFNRGYLHMLTRRGNISKKPVGIHGYLNIWWSFTIHRLIVKLVCSDTNLIWDDLTLKKNLSIVPSFSLWRLPQYPFYFCSFKLFPSKLTQKCRIESHTLQRKHQPSSHTYYKSTEVPAPKPCSSTSPEPWFRISPSWDCVGGPCRRGERGRTGARVTSKVLLTPGAAVGRDALLSVVVELASKASGGGRAVWRARGEPSRRSRRSCSDLCGAEERLGDGKLESVALTRGVHSAPADLFPLSKDGRRKGELAVLCASVGVRYIWVGKSCMRRGLCGPDSWRWRSSVIQSMWVGLKIGGLFTVWW